MRLVTFGLGLAALYLAAKDMAHWTNAGMKRLPRAHGIRKDKEVRDNLSERQLDDAIDDSFPASDPPTYY